ncbi:MAG: hypothetical protein EOP06_07065, partial [Proteobacteria bacterium]
MEQANSALQSVLASGSQYGSHETLIAVLCSSSVMIANGRHPSLPEAAFTINTDYLSRAPINRYLSYCEVCRTYGQHDLLKELKERILSEGSSESQLAAKSYFDSVESPSLVDKELDTPTNPDLMGEHLLGGAINNAQLKQPLEQLREQVRKCCPDSAWKIAIDFLGEFVRGNTNEAREQLDLLIESFPNAIVVYGMLSASLVELLTDSATLPGISHVSDQDYETDTEGDTSTWSEGQNEVVFTLLAYTGGKLSLRGALDNWISLAAKCENWEELQKIGERGGSLGLTDLARSAVFLSEMTKNRSLEAVAYFENALEGGWQPPLWAKAAYDQARASLGRWSELTKEAAFWLKTPDRSPTAIAPSLHALAVEGRSKEAFDAAKDNADDFPESCDAAFFVVQYAEVTSREDWVPLLLEFGERFPQDPRSGKTISIDEAIPLLTSKSHKHKLWSAYEAGLFPIHFIGESLARAYTIAGTGNGLKVWSVTHRPLNEESFRTKLLIDITALFSIERLGLWSELKASGFQLFIHPICLRALRIEEANLQIESRKRIVQATTDAGKLLDIIISPHIAMTDQDEADRIGGVVCDSWDADARSLLALIKLSSKIDRIEKQRLLSSLSDDYKSAVDNTDSDSARVIVLSANDVKAICLAKEAEAVVKCFDVVSISQQGRYWLNRFMARADLDRRASELSARTLRATNDFITKGHLTVTPSTEEPSLSDLKQVSEIARSIRQEQYLLWCDDAAYKALIEHEVPSSSTTSTWEVIFELKRRLDLSTSDFNSLASSAADNALLPAAHGDVISILVDGPHGVGRATTYLLRALQQLRLKENDAPGRVTTEARILVQQAVNYFSSDDAHWNDILDVFLENLPLSISKEFWDACFQGLAHSPPARWERIRVLAMRSYEKSQFRIQDCLINYDPILLHGFTPIAMRLRYT